jgi:transposase
MRRALLPAQLCEVGYGHGHGGHYRGERQASLFVGTQPFSTYLYAEATWTQASKDWLASHARMFAAWAARFPSWFRTI